MERYQDPGTLGDLEGAGPGGGTNDTRQYRAEGPPGSHVPVVLTVFLVVLALAVPVLWAVGIYGRLALFRGLDATAAAGYLTLAVVVVIGAVLYFWGQFSESR